MNVQLESKLVKAVLRKDKEETITSIKEGAVPTVQLFHHAFDERAYDVALVLSEHLVFTEKNKVVIGLVKNVATDFQRSGVCFKILENIVMNNNELIDLVMQDLFPSKAAIPFKKICQTIKLNNKLSQLDEKPAIGKKIKL